MEANHIELEQFAGLATSAKAKEVPLSKASEGLAILRVGKWTRAETCLERWKLPTGPFVDAGHLAESQGLSSVDHDLCLYATWTALNDAMLLKLPTRMLRESYLWSSLMHRMAFLLSFPAQTLRKHAT
jgi:hypothetical protein